MYSQPGNHFDVMGMDYGEAIPHVGRRYFYVTSAGDAFVQNKMYADDYRFNGVQNLSKNVAPVNGRRVLTSLLALPINSGPSPTAPEQSISVSWHRISTTPSGWGPRTRPSARSIFMG